MQSIIRKLGRWRYLCWLANHLHWVMKASKSAMTRYHQVLSRPSGTKKRQFPKYPKPLCSNPTAPSSPNLSSPCRDKIPEDRSRHLSAREYVCSKVWGDSRRRPGGTTIKKRCRITSWHHQLPRRNPSPVSQTRSRIIVTRLHVKIKTRSSNSKSEASLLLSKLEPSRRVSSRALTEWLN